MPQKKLSKNIFISNPFILPWTLIRIFSVTLLWWNVLWGMIITLFLDAVDGDIMERLSIRRNWYSQWDKWLDLWFYGALAAYIFTTFEPSSIKTLLLGLFFYRLIGNVLFALTKKEWFLFLFPNIFTDFFLLWLLIPNIITENLPLSVTLAVLGSLIKEWWIHIARLDITNLLTHRKKKWM